MHCLSIEYNHTYHTTGMVSKYYTSAGPGYVLHMRNDLKSGSIARNSWKAYYGTQLPHHRWGDQERCIKASRLALSGPWGTFIIFLNLDRFYAHPCKFTEIYVTPTMVVCECFVLVRQIATELQCINKLVVYKVSGLRTSLHIRVYIIVRTVLPVTSAVDFLAVADAGFADWQATHVVLSEGFDSIHVLHLHSSTEVRISNSDIEV